MGSSFSPPPLTGADIKAAYEGEANTNAMSDALLTKLNGIEASATADQSTTEIKSAVAGSGADGVGSYGFFQNISGSTKVKGNTVAGSQLNHADNSGDANTTAAGTWRCMGWARHNYSTVWLRIS